MFPDKSYCKARPAEVCSSYKSSYKGPNILRTLDATRPALTNHQTCNISNIMLQARWLANAGRERLTTKGMQRV